ncbi:MAG: hypothetical protein AB7N80_13465 [Bdellovibrionales bacterium]
MKNAFLGLMCLLTAATWAADCDRPLSAPRPRVPRLKSIAPFDHPVLAQTAAEVVSKAGGVQIARRFYIAKWGEHRYEYGYVDYQCGKTHCEQIGENVRLAMFEKCEGFSGGQPMCTQPVATDDGALERIGHEGLSRHPWYACEDHGNACGASDELSDFPEREAGGGPDDKSQRP